jgi:uncharacterized protein (DUF2236 family)
MHIDPIRLIHWVTGTSLPGDLPISDTDPDPGIMGPDSFTWRVHHEQWLILGGARAFLMQAAHPKVAQGALDHSAYAEDPFGRVYRTVMAMSVFLAGTTHEVNAMARQINRLHATVTGTINQASAGQHTVGEAYSGMDPDALLWVQVSFVDSMLSAYQHFVGPLSEAEREQYWQESLRYARRLGLTDATLPASHAAMQAYLREAIASGEVAVSPGARTVAHTILFPPLPWYRQRLWGVVRLITSGQLPPELRQGYGLPWNGTDWLAFKLISYLLRLTRWLFPNALGRSVLVSFAEQRARGVLPPTQPQTPSGVAD